MIKTDLRIISILFCLPFFLNCDSETDNSESPSTEIQAVTLLGDTLYTEINSLPQDLEQRINTFIDEAENNDDDLATMMIWQARKKGYEGDYRAAIDILTSALESYPNDPRLYRHRGHRYISVRAFDLAVADLKKAASMTDSMKDITEPDGLPNDKGIPLSTLKTNIWYHLGLARYLQGEYELAQEAYEKGLELSENNDMKVAMAYWYYLSLRKNGQDDKASDIIKTIEEDMTIIENRAYYDLILVFKGVFKPDHLLEGDMDALNNATIGYGLGAWHDINGRNDRALKIWRDVYHGSSKMAFGTIASEAELARQPDR